MKQRVAPQWVQDVAALNEGNESGAKVSLGLFNRGGGNPNAENPTQVRTSS
jgi:hypothetical protein